MGAVEGNSAMAEEIAGPLAVRPSGGEGQAWWTAGVAFAPNKAAPLSFFA